MWETRLAQIDFVLTKKFSRIIRKLSGWTSSVKAGWWLTVAVVAGGTSSSPLVPGSLDIW